MDEGNTQRESNPSERNTFTVIVSGFLLLLLLIGLGGVLTTLQGLSFSLELIALLLLTVMGILGVSDYNQRWGKTFLFFVFVFYLANIVVLWHLKGFFYLVLLLLALLGFMVNLPMKKVVKKERVQEFQQQEHQPLNVTPHTPPPQKEKEPEKKAATFSPGKYVASSKSNVYHEPKCDWAKKIKAAKVWFLEKKDAEEKQYKAHGCVK